MPGASSPRGLSPVQWKMTYGLYRCTSNTLLDTSQRQIMYHMFANLLGAASSFWMVIWRFLAILSTDFCGGSRINYSRSRRARQWEREVQENLFSMCICARKFLLNLGFRQNERIFRLHMRKLKHSELRRPCRTLKPSWAFARTGRGKN